MDDESEIELSDSLFFFPSCICGPTTNQSPISAYNLRPCVKTSDLQERLMCPAACPKMIDTRPMIDDGDGKKASVFAGAGRGRGGACMQCPHMRRLIIINAC